MSAPETTADRIRATAQALAQRGGYNSFSFQDIAKTVGIRKASVFHYWPAKQDLVNVLVEHHQRERMMPRMSWGHGAALYQLWRWGEQQQPPAPDQVELLTALLVDLPTLPPELADAVRAALASEVGWLTDKVDLHNRQTGRELRATPELEAWALLSCAVGAAVLARAQNRPELFDQVFECARLGLLTR